MIIFLKKTSNMGNNMNPYSIAVGEELVYSHSPHCKHIKRIKIKDYELLNTNGNSVVPFDYHVEKLRPDSFRDLLELTCIHSS